MSRCGTCKYDECMGNIECIKEECPLYNTANKHSDCTCVDCWFDMDGDCPGFTHYSIVTKDTGDTDDTD